MEKDNWTTIQTLQIIAGYNPGDTEHSELQNSNNANL